MNLIDIAERGLVPDVLVRWGIRRLLQRRRSEISSAGSVAEFARHLGEEPLAVATDQANEQHYEVPSAFFEGVLGPRMKYSACYFPDSATTLAEAEVAMLQRTCARAELTDGLRVLELGCGWGSLALWIAEQYPTSEITAISNSSSQRRFIEHQASRRGLTNIRVLTADIRDFDTHEQFDRIVSVEMFEHLRNYRILFRQLSRWLTPEGKAFVHIFCHRSTPYLFETEGPANWMGRHFFTGGMMPSENLFGEFADDLVIERQWRVEGEHYWRTCEAWLRNLDRHRDSLLHCLATGLPRQEALRHLQRWRIFFMACAELFRYREGQEWFVAHYLFRQARARHHTSADCELAGSR